MIHVLMALDGLLCSIRGVVRVVMLKNETARKKKKRETDRERKREIEREIDR